MRLLYTLFCLLFSVSVFSQPANERRHVKLMDASDIKSTRLITLIDNGSFSVITPRTAFINHYKAWIRKNPGILEDSILFNAIKNDTAGMIGKADSMAVALHCMDRLEFRLAAMLDAGKCFVYDRKQLKRIRQITIVNYTGAGANGKMYFVKNSLLLKVVTMVF